VAAGPLAGGALRGVVDRDQVQQHLEHIVEDCGGGLCVGPVTGGIRTVDVATGQTRWTTQGWGHPKPVGSYLLAVGSGDPPQVAALDPATGNQAGEFGIATSVSSCEAGTHAVVCRRADGTIGVWAPRLK
jgi:hypothetical protein